MKDSIHNDLKSYERSSQEHHPEELQPVRGGEGGWDQTLCSVGAALAVSLAIGHNPGRVATPTQYNSMLALIWPTSEGWQVDCYDC